MLERSTYKPARKAVKHAEARSVIHNDHLIRTIANSFLYVPCHQLA